MTNNTYSVLFPPTSRYYNSETTTIETGEGKQIVFLKRRFLPSSDRLATIHEHQVTEGERLDTITALYFNDPLLFWRICDANTSMNPPELTAEIGRRLRITLPEGIPEIPNVVR
jgi:hypothetical protein